MIIHRCHVRSMSHVLSVFVVSKYVCCFIERFISDKYSPAMMLQIFVRFAIGDDATEIQNF